mgnify:CR=1 FL=1
MGEEEILGTRLKDRGLKQSGQRREILAAMRKSRKHFTTDELYRVVRGGNPNIGYATVYRTLRLLCEFGLCRELVLEDGITRFELTEEHKHHDHLICRKCGKFVEVVDEEIERLQKKLVRKHGFIEDHHRMEVYGICRECAGTKEKK